VSNSFALGSKTFNQVLFAIELTGVSWDFGALVFNNVVIVSYRVRAVEVMLTEGGRRRLERVRNGARVLQRTTTVRAIMRCRV